MCASGARTSKTFHAGQLSDPSWDGDYRPSMVDGQWSIVTGPWSCHSPQTRRYGTCPDGWMRAKKLEDVVVYRESCDAADEISAMLERAVFSKDFNLKD